MKPSRLFFWFVMFSLLTLTGWFSTLALLSDSSYMAPLSLALAAGGSAILWAFTMEGVSES